MIMKEINLNRLFAYNDWANRKALKSIEQAQNPPALALERMGHLIGAEEIWLQRLCGEPSTAEVWPALSIDECRQRLDVLKMGWQTFLDSLRDKPADVEIHYQNTKGVSYSNRVDDVLMHVFAHAAYHRGQIASDLRAAGDTPAATDFIVFQR